MKLYFSPGASSLSPHIVFRELGLPFEPVWVDLRTHRLQQVKPAIDAAGGKYLSRGGRHKVYEGDWQPRRMVLLEFPSVEAFEAFYNSSTYQDLKGIRDACSSAPLVAVEDSTRA